MGDGLFRKAARALIAFAGAAWLTLAAMQPALARAPHANAVDEVRIDGVRIDRVRIDRALAEMVASGRVVGASALVWQDGQEVYFGQQGLADREAGHPMARDTLVRIFSMTKPVTGVALMQLWEQGRFRLDDPLSRYLPAFGAMRVQDGIDASGKPLWRPARRPILIRDILRHTAGFAYGEGPTPAHAAFVKADPLALDHDLAEFGRRIAGVPLVADPGMEWRYSAAVDVQALLVENLSGMAFADYVAKAILVPLGMTQTGWHQPMERLPRFAATYRRESDGALVRVPDAQSRAMNFPGSRLTMGGAGLVAPIDDYMRFARMLLGRGELDGVRILRPSTVALMATNQLDPAITNRHWLPGKGNVGFGFDFAVRMGQPLSPEENRGATGEFFWDGLPSTLFWVDPANKIAAIFFVQLVPFDGTLHRDIRRAVYGDTTLGPPGD